MREQEAVRRLVKSPPELWAQCSDPVALTRHLGDLGEITITRLEPESTVAWEGESVSGTVTLEASGWGTRVRLTATPPAVGDPATDAGSGQFPPALVMSPTLPARGFPARFLTLLKRHRQPLDEIVPTADPVPADASAGLARPGEASLPAGELLAVLEAALDSLGQAHHRPYSRG